MPNEPSPLAIEEFRALRATIRERGTLRLAVLFLSFAAWAALAVSLQFQGAGPALALLPLGILAAGFEVVFVAHVGVERIGRYLQVRYEEPGAGATWEHTAMGWPPASAPPGADALASRLFILSVALNAMLALRLVPSTLLPDGNGSRVLALAGTALLHLGLIARIMQARRYAVRQRERDLAHLTQRTKHPDI